MRQPLPKAATRDPAEEFRIIGEWDWWETSSGNVLHSANVAYDPNFQVWGIGITACGCKARLFIPGIFSRMGLRRCTRCCKALGYPQGTGSPTNGRQFGSFVEKRLAGR